MAQLTRAQIQTKITNWITTNGDKEITGAQVNEILTDMIDSGFLQLDEVRTAQSVLYQLVGNPTDWNGGTAPATQNLVNDELAQRLTAFETNNFSQDIAFVSNDGDDLTAELGNPSKPFKTIKAAWEGSPQNNAVIKVLGGTYSETSLDFTLFQKTNFILDLSSITLTTSNPTVGLRPQGSSKGAILLHGATLNCALRLGSNTAREISVYGGTINGFLDLGEKSYIQGVNINSSSFVAVQSEIENIEERAYLSNCRIVCTSSSFAAIFQVSATFSNCFIQGVNVAYQPFSSNTRYSKFINCTLKTTGASSATIFGANGVLNGIFKQCKIESQGGKAVEVGGAANTSTSAFFEDCDIIADTDCVNINSNLERTAATRTTFKRCSFYTNTGEIVTGTPNVADLGKTSLIGTTLTNKALLGGLTNFEVIGDQLTVTDAQIPPL